MVRLLIFVLLFSMTGTAQENLSAATFEFRMFKHYDADYKIDFDKKQLSFLISNRGIKEPLFKKAYKFTDEQVDALKQELSQNIPDSIIRKGEDAMDGGYFQITYLKKDNTVSKLYVRNFSIRMKKYLSELQRIDSFFKFAYTVVTDKDGVKYLDDSYDPYFRGVPIRKISDNPLEYKIWGSLYGNMSHNPRLNEFLEGLPKDRCVIIDCGDNLSPVLQDDILKMYIKQESNIKFANNEYLGDLNKSYNPNIKLLRKKCK